MTRRLTNQDAFDKAMLSLLNQGHSCSSASGHARYRGPRGKSAIGALIPDELYLPSMEGKNVRHWLAARGSEYDGLRARLGGVTPALLDELQDLHDRIGSCMPSLYRQLAVAGAQRIAQSFKLSMRLILRGATYQSLRGPYLLSMVGLRPAPRTVEVAPPPERALAPMPAAAPSANLAPTPMPAVAASTNLAATPMPATAPSLNLAPTPMPAVAPSPNLAPTPLPAAAPSTNPAVTPMPAVTSALTSAITTAPTLAMAPTPAETPPLGAAPLPAADPKPSPQSQENDLDLIARGIAKAIAAARARDQPGSKP